MATDKNEQSIKEKVDGAIASLLKKGADKQGAGNEEIVVSLPTEGDSPSIHIYFHTNKLPSVEIEGFKKLSVAMIQRAIPRIYDEHNLERIRLRREHEKEMADGQR